MKLLHSICQQIWKAHQWPQDWKRSIFILIQKKGNAKECSYYHIIAFISHTSKVMLKKSARLQQYVNRAFPDVQAGFRKGRRNVYNIIYETSRQSRFNARYWMLGAGALGRPRGMVQGGRRDSGWGTRVYPWQIHADVWQNQYNIVKLNNKI